MPAVNDKNELVVGPCPTKCKVGEFMCVAHWAMVPPDNKRLIFDAQRQDNSEGRRHHSPVWMACAREAIMMVWKAQVAELVKSVTLAGDGQAKAAPKVAAPAEADSRPTDEAHP